MAFRLLKPRLSPILRPSIIPHPPKPTNPNPNPNFSLILRHFSSSRHPPDILTRARHLQTRRLWSYGLTISCMAGFITVVLANFQDYLLFYITPTDALTRASSNPSKTRYRLGGLVLDGSITYPSPSSPEMEFVVTDLLTDILVRYEGNLPDLFREGHSVVVEGVLRTWEGEGEGVRVYEGPAVTEKARGLDLYFRATEVLAKHDEKYMPKEVAAAIERNKRRVEGGGGLGVLGLEKTS